MVVLASFNCNGLHDHKKWHSTWKLLKSMNTDIIVLQETHLQQKQECVFRLHAQCFDCFFSHGTSQSALVAMIARCNAGLVVRSFVSVSPHLAALDVVYHGNELRFLACYAPPQHGERLRFFHRPEGKHYFRSNHCYGRLEHSPDVK